MRRGPNPLPVHIGMVSALVHRGVLKGIDNPLEASEEDIRALARVESLKAMFAGMKRYQALEIEIPRLSRPVVWREGAVSLQHIARGSSDAKQKEILLLVPSLINRSYILDLYEGRSFAAWLAQQGRDVYLLDWGDLRDDADLGTIEHVITRRLIPVLEFLRQECGGMPVQGLGYCMGGTLLLGAAALRPDLLQKMVLLAAPWDFHAGTGKLLGRVKFWAPSALPAVHQRGYLPGSYLQMLFASLDPETTISKFEKFSIMVEDSDACRLFVAVEDWLNDEVDLPRDVAQECIDGWFLRNHPAHGKWMLDGMVIDPRAVATPSLVVTAQQDRIVEGPCAAILGNLLPNSQALAPNCGHIGLMAGRRAKEEVWQPVDAWLKS